ncbi:MAG TPA: hypothetical protein VFE25_07250, partial [Opitutaceae bacterium]|nr:hypothetical protein [Opitutaceae bacterium]
MKFTENASSRLKHNSATFAAILCVATTGLLASEYPEMKRLVPVPADQPIPIFDFVRPPQFGAVHLNHTGTTVGAIVPGNADARSLVTYNLSTQLLDGVSAPQGDQEISSFEWLDGDRLAYLDTFGKGESVGVLFLSSAGKLAEAETVGIQGAAGVVQLLGNTPEDRSQFLVNLKGFNFRYDHPELINAKAHGSLITRYPDLKTDHGFNIVFWPNKVNLLEYGITQEDGILALHHLEGENWVKSPIDVDQVDVFDSGDNPGEIVGLGARDGNSPRPLEYIDVATGQAKEILLQDKGYDFHGTIYRDPVSHNIVGAAYDRAAPHIVWFTQGYRDLQKVLDGLFPNQVVRIVDMDDAGKVVLISSWSD